jgi:hypothetical protein
VVEAIDYLRRATPAAVFQLAAERWRKSAKRRRRRQQLGDHRGAVGAAAATLLDEEEWGGDDVDGDGDDEADEGPDWLTHEALAAATNHTRPSAPGWSFLPLAVTVGLCVALNDAHWPAMYREPMT